MHIYWVISSRLQVNKSHLKYVIYCFAYLVNCLWVKTLKDADAGSELRLVGTAAALKENQHYYTT